MHFNPDTARNEMLNFWEVLLSPVAVNKFLHTIASGYVLAAIFVIGISAWYLLKNREQYLAKRSMLVAGVFGLISSLMLIYSGDGSAKLIARIQPVKFASLEGVYKGQKGAGLVAVGILGTSPRDTTRKNQKDFIFRIEIPNFLSYMAFGEFNAFVPGINDLVDGNPQQGIISAAEKIDRGKFARESLAQLKDARDKGDTVVYNQLKQRFNDSEFRDNYFRYFGYGFLNSPESVIPSVPIAFYSFHIMVLLGFYFLLLLVVVLLGIFRDWIDKYRFLLRLCIITIPLTYIASQSGWVLTELGRQPWAIQDLLPVMAAVSHINTSSVQITFFLFAVLFTALLIAEVSIMIRQIKTGPKNGGH